ATPLLDPATLSAPEDEAPLQRGLPLHHRPLELEEVDAHRRITGGQGRGVASLPDQLPDLVHLLVGRLVLGELAVANAACRPALLEFLEVLVLVLVGGEAAVEVGQLAVVPVEEAAALLPVAIGIGDRPDEGRALQEL